MDALLAIVVFIVLAAVYFIPAIAADQCKHKSATAIFVFNLFLGWTFLGWVLALVWALNKPAISTIAPREPPEPTKICPFCAEHIQQAAKVCKHCQRDQPPAVPATAGAVVLR